MSYVYDWDHDLSIIKKTFASPKSGAAPSITPAHMEHWERLKAGCRTNEDIYVIRIPDGGVIMRHDCSRLWPPEQDNLSYKDVAALYHPAQAPLICWLVPKIFQILFHHIDKNKAPNYRLRWLRAIRTQDGKFKYVCYECLPFQYTDENVMYSYVGRMAYLKPYAGESLHVSFWYDGHPDATDVKRLDLLNGFLDNTKTQALEKVFKMTAIRAEIIQRIASGQNHPEVASNMGVKVSTTKDHCKSILKTMRTTLPSETFNRIDDVVRYFKHTGLLAPPSGRANP